MGFVKIWGAPKMVSFEFAYNNPLFSDRILQMEVTPFVDQAFEVVEKSEELHTEKLLVNSAILAAHSDYFMRMFSKGMSELSSGVAIVHVNEEGDKYDVIDATEDERSLKRHACPGWSRVTIFWQQPPRKRLSSSWEDQCACILQFTAFAESMAKMERISVLTGTVGQIRKHCWVRTYSIVSAVASQSDRAFGPLSSHFCKPDSATPACSACYLISLAL